MNICDAGISFKLLCRAAAECNENCRQKWMQDVNAHLTASQMVFINETSKDERTHQQNDNPLKALKIPYCLLFSLNIPWNNPLETLKALNFPWNVFSRILRENKLFSKHFNVFLMWSIDIMDIQSLGLVQQSVPTLYKGNNITWLLLFHWMGTN